MARDHGSGDAYVFLGDDAEPVVDRASNADVEQDTDPPMVTVPVRVEGLARAQSLPAQQAGFTTVDVTTTGVQVLAADPLRVRALVYALDGTVVLAERQAGLTTGATLVPGGWLMLGASSAVWAKSLTGTVRLTVISERWTE